MNDNQDVFELLGERGPPLQNAIQELLLRLQDDGYAQIAIVAAFSQVAVSVAAKLADTESIEVVARAFEGYSRNCVSLLKPTPSAERRPECLEVVRYKRAAPHRRAGRETPAAGLDSGATEAQARSITDSGLWARRRWLRDATALPPEEGAA